jgi:hypothetical protein
LTLDISFVIYLFASPQIEHLTCSGAFPPENMISRFPSASSGPRMIENAMSTLIGMLNMHLDRSRLKHGIGVDVTGIGNFAFGLRGNSWDLPFDDVVTHRNQDTKQDTM